MTEAVIGSAGARRLLAPLILAGALLSGCAHPPAGPVGTPDSPTDTTAAQVRYPGPWDGRMSLKLAAFGTESAKGVQVNFSLDGSPAKGSLDLSTPLGTRMASVHWHERMAVLRTSDGDQPFDSLDALTRHVLGEALPITALMAWLEGGPSLQQPWQGQPEGNLRQFTQAGWQVDLQGRSSGHIDALRPASAQQRGVTLRVRVDQ